MSASSWSWEKVSAEFAALRASPRFRTSTSNATYSVLEYVAQPLLMIAAAPFLVSRLGLEQYGIWMLASALAGTVGIFSLGIADATLKYVSAYLGGKDRDAVSKIIRTSLTISYFLGGAGATLVILMAPALVQHIVKVGPSHRTMAVHAFQLAGIVLLFRTIDSVFASTLRAYEAYGRSVRVTLFTRAIIVGSAVFLVALGHGIVAIMWATLAAVALGAGLQARSVHRLVSTVSFLPRLERQVWQEIRSFGFYSWVQSVAAVLFSQLDRFVVGAFLGMAAVSYYTLCVQLAQPVHGLLAAAFNFLFPHVSGRLGARDRQGYKRVFRLAVIINLICALLLCLPLVVFGKAILTRWMGVSFAEQSSLLLGILAVAFCILSINVVPHYTLLGLGEARFVSLVNVMGGVLSLAGTIALIPFIGLVGAAVGRLLYGPVVTLNYIKVARSL